MPDPFDTDPAGYEELLANALMGDAGASRTLVSILAPVIRRVASRLAPRDFREDLIQEVWVHLWARNCHVLQMWKRERPFLNYVAIVASNLIRDRLAQRQIPTDPEDPDVPDPENPEQLLQVGQLAECLKRAKERLSRTYWEIIHQRHELGMKLREIAACSGRTIGTVSGTLARAEKYLREEIQETCSDHLGPFLRLFR